MWGSNPSRGKRIFSLPKRLDRLWRPTWPRYSVGTGILSWGVKRPEGDADHLPPSGAEVNNDWNCTYILPYAFMVWAGTLPLPFSYFYPHKSWVPLQSFWIPRRRKFPQPVAESVSSNSYFYCLAYKSACTLKSFECGDEHRSHDMQSVVTNPRWYQSSVRKFVFLL